MCYHGNYILSMKKAELLVLRYALEMHGEMNGPGVYLECMFSTEVTPPPKNLRTFQAGSDLRKTSSPPVPQRRNSEESDMKKDHPTQGFLHSGPENLQGRTFHNVSG